MAEDTGDDGMVSVSSINLSTQSSADCPSAQSAVNSHAASGAQFTAEELYKHALQFYKGT